MKKMVDFSHDFIKEILHKEAVCLDATLGNGHDAAFLLKAGIKKLYAFELQEEVYQKTLAKLDDPRLIAVRGDHADLDKYIDGQLDAAIFNFGYAPGFDPAVKTGASSSILAVNKALDRLRKHGRCALVIYPHEEGHVEGLALEEALQARSDIVYLKLTNPQAQAPALLMVEKK